ncbi:MAG: M50 family metallopeptidase [Anaerolineales bacterium]|jgi:regulator of sigma E protease
METISSILQLVGVLAGLILIHELGHFVAARLFKIEVEEFGIGFPPRMLTIFEAGGTKYTLNWLPFGGFVRPKGENDADVPGGLAAANPWVRLVVYASGPLMNLLVGVLIYTTMFSQIGAPDPTRVQVLDVASNSPAAMAGLQEDDIIIEVNGVEIDDSLKLHNTIYDHLGDEISITYLRDGNTVEVLLIPRENPPEGEGAIGILMGNPTMPVKWIEAIPLGATATYNHGMALLTLPAQIIQGNVSPEVARPVGYKGMYDIYQEVREGDLLSDVPANLRVLGFVNMITISLAILNLLPIPALDGGRIVFTLPEIILRRRIPPELENWINLISFTALILLFLYINLLDFTNPVQLP